jgi:hypothetical protein
MLLSAYVSRPIGPFFVFITLCHTSSGFFTFRLFLDFLLLPLASPIPFRYLPPVASESPGGRWERHRAKTALLIIVLFRMMTKAEEA